MTTAPTAPAAPRWSASDHEIRWLLKLTGLPTAAGKEHRVIDWITRWTRERSDLRLRTDSAGNLIIERAAAAPPGARTLFITAHLDHPAFVVERVQGPGTVVASFRGGVLDPYFVRARVRLFVAGGEATGTIVSSEKATPFRLCTIELDAGAPAPSPGDIGRWDLPEPSIEGDLIHTHACDDLAALAAAVATMERLRSRADAAHVKLLFTRAEEIGFVGAIAACKARTMEDDARVIALENSRSFAESPIGAGPIVRVGDRISTFHPGLTAAVAKVAEACASADAAFRWQRKLMPGGACEASAFQTYGYEATCVCLPLGNYHNMADLDRVQAGDAAAVAGAKVGREFVSLSDYKGMIALLERCAAELGDAEPLIGRMEKLYADHAFVL